MEFQSHILKTPIFSGADVNALRDDGSTPLMLAVAMNNSRIVNCLFKSYGAKDDYGDASERTAMYWAANENAMESLQVCSHLI